MNSTFLLIDLVSQAEAVKSLLRGRSAEEKIEWLSSHGSITPKPRTRPEEKLCFWFESRTGSICCFFLDGDEFVFLGNHTTFIVSDPK